MQAHAATDHVPTQQENDSLSRAQQNVDTQTQKVQVAEIHDNQAASALATAQSNAADAIQAANQAQSQLQSDQIAVSHASAVVSAAQSGVNHASQAYSEAQSAQTNRAQTETQLSEAKTSQNSVAAQNADSHLDRAVSTAQNSLSSAQSAQRSASSANDAAQADLHNAEQNMQNAGHSLDVTTQNIINAPAGYKNDFYENGRGIGRVPVFSQVAAQNWEYLDDDATVFMPDEYRWTNDGDESRTVSELRSYVTNNPVGNGIEYAYVYDDGTNIGVTNDINTALRYSNRPISLWYEYEDRLSDASSVAYYKPAQIEFYKYEDSVIDHQSNYKYAKTWDSIPEDKRATARPQYLSALQYVNNQDLAKINVPDATHLTSDVQQKLTEYAANIINNFNQQAGFPGRVVANNVAIQKTTQVAQEQTDPNNHQADHLAEVHAIGENIGEDALGGSDNNSLDDLYQGIHDSILNMLFPDLIDQEGDWDHAQTFYQCYEPTKGDQPSISAVTPAKLGIAFDRFGHIHFDFYNPSDADFNNSTDYTSGTSTDNSALQNALSQARTRAQNAQTALTNANNAVHDAQTALDNAKSALTNWQNAKKEADQKVQDLQNALTNTTADVLKQARSALDEAIGALTQAKKAAKIANDKVTADHAALQKAKNNLSQAQAQLAAAQGNKARTAAALAAAQSALAQARRELAVQEAVHGNGNAGTLPDNPSQPTTNPSSSTTNPSTPAKPSSASSTAVAPSSNAASSVASQSSASTNSASSFASQSSNNSSAASSAGEPSSSNAASASSTASNEITTSNTSQPFPNHSRTSQASNSGNSVATSTLVSQAAVSTQFTGEQRTVNNGRVVATNVTMNSHPTVPAKVSQNQTKLPQTGDHTSFLALIAAGFSMSLGLGLADKQSKKFN